MLLTGTRRQSSHPPALVLNMQQYLPDDSIKSRAQERSLPTTDHLRALSIAIIKFSANNIMRGI
jgi:hypothetical protein